MASGTMSGTLRYLRDLFHDGTSVGLGDGQLIARYAASRDESAFEALVARHGSDRQSAHRLVDRPQAHQANLGDAAVLLSRLGLPGRIGSTLGKTKTHRRQETGTQRPLEKSLINCHLRRSTAPPGFLSNRPRCSLLREVAIVRRFRVAELTRITSSQTHSHSVELQMRLPVLAA
jgi:hypothetical protein